MVYNKKVIIKIERGENMLINRIDHDIKLICIELELTQKELAKRINALNKHVNSMERQ